MNIAIQEFFDVRAHKWESFICPEHPERLKIIFSQLTIAPGSTVVDVGTGSGVALPILAQRTEGKVRFIAVDLAYKMVVEARKRTAADLEKHDADYMQGDVCDIPLAPNSIDWIICNSCFPHFADQQRCVSQIATCLRPGGRLLICHTESRETINTFHRKVGDIVGGHELPDDDAMKALVSHAGLHLLHLEDSATQYIMLAEK